MSASWVNVHWEDNGAPHEMVAPLQTAPAVMQRAADLEVPVVVETTFPAAAPRAGWYLHTTENGFVVEMPVQEPAAAPRAPSPGHNAADLWRQHTAQDGS